MFESITRFLKKITKKQLESVNKNEAKERLHLVLLQDRANVSADFLDMMKQEIIDVIKKYIDVNEDEIDVKLTNKQNSDGTTGAPALYANIPIAGIKSETRKLSNKMNLEKMEKNKKDDSKDDSSKNTNKKDNQKKNEKDSKKDHYNEKNANNKGNNESKENISNNESKEHTNNKNNNESKENTNNKSNNESKENTNNKSNNENKENINNKSDNKNKEKNAVNNTAKVMNNNVNTINKKNKKQKKNRK